MGRLVGGGGLGRVGLARIRCGGRAALLLEVERRLSRRF